MSETPIATLPWKKIAATVNRVIKAREVTFRQFTKEIGVSESLAHFWIRHETPHEPRRAAVMKISAWCEKHLAKLSK